jgi:hypothetical protein
MNANMTAPRCLVAAIDADLRFGLTSRSRENGCNSVSSGTRSRPGGSLSGPPRFVPGSLSLEQLISRRRRACGANQPIRLFQNVGIFRLFSREKADHHERRAK